MESHLRRVALAASLSNNKFQPPASSFSVLQEYPWLKETQQEEEQVQCWSDGDARAEHRRFTASGAQGGTGRTGHSTANPWERQGDVGTAC